MSRVVALSPAADAETGFANLEAEAAFLGAALSNNRVVTEHAAALRPEHFSEPLHGRIYGRLLELMRGGATVTPVTLKPYFDGDEALRDLGGITYLIRLTGDGQGLLAPRELAEQIGDLAQRRRLRDAFRDGLADLSDLAIPTAEIASAAEQVTASADHRPPSFPLLDFASLAELPPIAKPFIIQRIAPAGEVTLFTGPGAVGKSLLGQQFATAKAAGVATLGLSLEPGPAIYLTCEDDAEQLHWRQAHICRALGVTMASLAGKLHVASLRGALDNELATFTTTGKMSVAPGYHRLLGLMQRSRARLVVLDNVAHLFTGNENDRSEVTAFVNLLNRAAGETGAAIMLLGHPNKAGDSYSGSTAWLNAVRSQVFMGRAEGDEADADPDARSVTVGKPNYCERGEALRFRWHDWAFILEDALPADTRAEIAQISRANAENAAFMRCLAAATVAKRPVSHNPGVNYAPAVFAKMAEGKGFGRKAFEAAFERLLHIGEIALDQQLWKRENRTWKFGIKASSKCTDPPAPTPRTEAHRPHAETGTNACTDPHAPTPLYPTDILDGAEDGPPSNSQSTGSAVPGAAPNREGS